MRDRGRSHSKVPGRCRACSTAERTATNIIQAPIARVHRAPCAPCSSRLCSPLLLPSLLLPAPAPCAPAPAPAPCAPAPAPCSSLLLALLALALLALTLVLPSLAAPFARSSLLGFGAALRHFRAPRVRAIPYLGFASQRLA